jgi:ribosomal RNA-processing protein 9
MTKKLLQSLSAEAEDKKGRAQKTKQIGEHEHEHEDEDEDEEDKEGEVYAGSEKEIITQKLKLAYMEKQGRVFKPLADRVQEANLQSRTFFKGHKKSITCLEVAANSKTAYTGAKDCCIIRWDLATGKKDIFAGEKHNRSIQGHFDEVRSRLDQALGRRY